MKRLLAVLFCVHTVAVFAQPSRADDDKLFRETIAPIFAEHCVRCHHGAKPKGGLVLSESKGISKGGESGPVVAAGKPDESLLLEYIAGEKPQMPKNAEPLSEAQVDAVRRWIAAGARWPDGLVLEERRGKWWSLEPLHKPPLPSISAEDASWVRTPVDAFIVHRLRREGLQPSPEADRRTLIRRLTFDLHGLPPTLEEIATFLDDPRPDAYERLVDRLLESPRYGERWARHWLDVVHYGETHGYDKDKRRPNAWPYRDYVIRSFNKGKPYSRFVLEQLAGDVLYPEDSDGIVATGFVVAGPWDFVGHVELREGTLDKNITRNLDRDDMVTNAMSTFVSMTVHCARCHDHKFDPIPQRDYYGLQSVFAGVERTDRPYVPDPNSSPLPAQPLVYAATPAFAAQGSFTPAPGGKPRPVHVLARGNVTSPGELAEPGALSCIPELFEAFKLANPEEEGQRRVALARWIVDPRNPLTWRSIVNRVWNYHFGAGIVDSPNDFGRMGSRPTHLELLDWLAADFRDGSQSLKDLHRLIVTSSVYRQSSTDDAGRAKIDSGNRYLWRINSRRLDAECIRDAVLAVSGNLDAAMYGPGFDRFGFKDDHSPHYDYEAHDVDDPRGWRRSVYRFIVRSVPDPFMESFDCADPSLSVPVRNQTITSLQALSLLNNRFMVSEAKRLAARAEAMNSPLNEQVAAVFRLALGREADESEKQTLTQHAQKHGLANTCRLIFNMNEFVFVD
ncbi:MAG: PSD1 and planctomycete cytochrome C domain-containing protein [Planctomycetaceae bacterium]